MEKFDFFPMINFMKDIIVSEKLKESIEFNNIQGFEFSELDYGVVIGE
ncbi:ethanolamine utilization cobalamin adenosyltransferase [Chryseobacterium jejuense]|nr:ethanolamine utilization cobalamin adenosyltransferase [Chryseobacterium jejuense]